MSKENNSKNSDTLGAARKQRRGFLTYLWSLLGLAAILEMGWLTRNIFFFKKNKNITVQDGDKIEAGALDEFEKGSVTPVPKGSLYLTRLDDGSVLALSPVCTHLGCSVKWNERKGEFICPCHGSSFSMVGEVTSSPATRPMDIHPVRIEDGVVIIDTTIREHRTRFEPSQATKV